MAIALKDLKKELLPGLAGELYPGWRFARDFSTDMVLIEGPNGYRGMIPRTKLEDCGLDGVMEFIVQKDARMKRYPSLRAAMEEYAKQEYARMCAKSTSESVAVNEASAARMKALYENLYKQEFRPADYQPKIEKPKGLEPMHVPWTGVREVDLD